MAATQLAITPFAGYIMPRVVVIGANRVLRGGSWNNNGRNVRSANRNRNEPGNRNNNIGFRLALAQKDSYIPLLTRLPSCPLPRQGQKANALWRVSRRQAGSPPKRRPFSCVFSR
ncbi:MAG: hypothetical protein DM484_05690 [Candidatus Methylumidiphilus alinenensis]|uniref:Sulfatase-modifying factor enzyme-like domain-containing protein n=1 Tax=Candidatus Methylumidiphilus alinenensis TaxID=2202197 RepID=A0A2W4RG98_9GAMM|nr:MAG: hypothetical protein DM484_05690 [Candidatus Methylumidiphilus alinenensis]